jgi:hypothetical protein
MVHLQQHADHHVMLTTRVRPSRIRLLLCSRTPVVSGCPGPVAPFRAQTTLDLLRPQALYLPVLSRDFLSVRQGFRAQGLGLGFRVQALEFRV